MTGAPQTAVDVRDADWYVAHRRVACGGVEEERDRHDRGVRCQSEGRENG